MHCAYKHLSYSHPRGLGHHLFLAAAQALLGQARLVLVSVVWVLSACGQLARSLPYGASHCVYGAYRYGRPQARCFQLFRYNTKLAGYLLTKSVSDST